MENIPSIKALNQGNDFHDSSLIWFHYDPVQDIAIAIVSTPNEFSQERLWMISMEGVLAIEMETLGDGEQTDILTPPEIYDIYDDTESLIAKRWNKRLETLLGKNIEVHSIVFASSFLRGWGQREDLEGFQVVCRRLHISYAPEEFKGKEFGRPRIPSVDST